MIPAKIKVIPLATTKDMSCILIPCIIHKNTPNTNIEYITKEIPEVSLVLITCKACGSKLNVVNVAAIGPIRFN